MRKTIKIDIKLGNLGGKEGEKAMEEAEGEGKQRGRGKESALERANDPKFATEMRN